jgi:hypothetical protein
MSTPPDETGSDWTGYPHRKPNLIVHLIRWAWRLFLLLVVIWGAIALYLAFRWWMVPILLVFGFCTYVLFRNRWRRARR